MDITSKLVNDTGRPTPEQEQALREQLLTSAWGRLPYRARLSLEAFVKHPTERNTAYVTGYMCALRDCLEINAADYSYWLAAIGSLERTSWLRLFRANANKD